MPQINITAGFTVIRGHELAEAAQRGNPRSLARLGRLLVDTINDMQSQLNNTALPNKVATAAGAMTGAGSLMTVTTGFHPKFVEIVDKTKNRFFDWYSGWTVGQCIKYSGASGPIAFPSDGPTPTATGFTFQSVIGVAGDLLSYQALRTST